ncbi:MAG: hypothetical protein EXR57_04670 [Dehalococcoidia bacterium]|nr:hypothetical protein [Dehalococcoidia bacterium]MSQ35093.1 hypothetical protein [Dehalococcoidia bacterium]
MEYLLRTQQVDGGREEADYTATGFPGYGIVDRKFKSPGGERSELAPGEMPAAFMIK